MMGPATAVNIDAARADEGDNPERQNIQDV